MKLLGKMLILGLLSLGMTVSCTQLDISLPKGEQGIQGERGANGKDGLSAYEVWMKAIQDNVITDWSKNKLTLADFFKYLQGKEGKAGRDGAKGEKGDTGAKGEKGDKGNAGQNGTNGKDGKNGKDGVDGKSAYELWKGVISSGNVNDPHNPSQKWNAAKNSMADYWHFLTGATGEKGPKGDKGDAGQNGTNGKDGKDGKDGLDGKSAYELWKIFISSGNVNDPHNPSQKWNANKNTEADFYEFLTGKKGQDGKDGKDGECKPCDKMKKLTKEERDKLAKSYTLSFEVVQKSKNNVGYDDRTGDVTIELKEANDLNEGQTIYFPQVDKSYPIKLVAFGSEPTATHKIIKIPYADLLSENMSVDARSDKALVQVGSEIKASQSFVFPAKIKLKGDAKYYAYNDNAPALIRVVFNATYIIPNAGDFDMVKASGKDAMEYEHSKIKNSWYDIDKDNTDYPNHYRPFRVELYTKKFEKSSFDADSYYGTYPQHSSVAWQWYAWNADLSATAARPLQRATVNTTACSWRDGNLGLDRNWSNELPADFVQTNSSSAALQASHPNGTDSGVNYVVYIRPIAGYFSLPIDGVNIHNYNKLAPKVKVEIPTMPVAPLLKKFAYNASSKSFTIQAEETYPQLNRHIKGGGHIVKTDNSSLASRDGIQKIYTPVIDSYGNDKKYPIVLIKGTKVITLEGLVQDKLGQSISLTAPTELTEGILEGATLWVTSEGSTWKNQQHFWPVKMGIVEKDTSGSYKLKYDTALGMGTEFAQ